MQKRDISVEHAPQPASAYSQAVEITGGTRLEAVKKSLLGRVGACLGGSLTDLSERWW